MIGLSLNPVEWLSKFNQRHRKVSGPRPEGEVSRSGSGKGASPRVCSACGQKIKPPPLTNAERQRRYRERKKERENG